MATSSDGVLELRVVMLIGYYDLATGDTAGLQIEAIVLDALDRPVTE